VLSIVTIIANLFEPFSKELMQEVEKLIKGVPKIHTVILSKTKDLMFFFSSQKIKKNPLALRPQNDAKK
jgi:hypothetical protein